MISTCIKGIYYLHTSMRVCVCVYAHRYKPDVRSYYSRWSWREEMKFKLKQSALNSTSRVQGNICKSIWQPEIPKSLWKRVKSALLKKIPGFDALYCANGWYIVLMPFFLQGLSTGKHKFLYYSNIHWWSRCNNAVPNIASFSSRSIGVVAPIAPALQVQMLPVTWCNLSFCQAMDAQPQRSWRPEFSPLHHHNRLTTSGTKLLWQRDKAEAKVFLAVKKQTLKRDSVTSQSDHSFPLRKHFQPHRLRHTSVHIIPKYICLLWCRAVTAEREACYCEWNLFRRLPSLSGTVCSDTAMGGSVNCWNAGRRVQKRWPSPLGRAAAPCPCQAAQLCSGLGLQQLRRSPPAPGTAPGRAGGEGDAMCSCRSSRLPD